MNGKETVFIVLILSFLGYALYVAKKNEPEAFFISQECVLVERKFMLGRYKEQYITHWDCGKYGNLICHKPEVFKNAHDRENIILRINGDRVYIYGIKYNH